MAVKKKVEPERISRQRGSDAPKKGRSKDGTSETVLDAFRAMARESTREKYLLRLYVAGTNSKSARAIENVRRICEEHLAGRYDLEVIDLYEHRVLSKGEQIVAVPTLIKKLPAPLRKFIGDMSDTDRILVGLDLRPKKA